MAITILSQPLNPIEPIFVEGGWNNSFTLNSTISNQCSMKYVGDLRIDGVLITRIKNSPNLQDGKCVITPWRILEDYVSGDRYLGEVPIFQNCQDSQIRYSLRFGEESDGTLGCTGSSFNVTLGPSRQLFGFNGTLQYGEEWDYTEWFVSGDNDGQFLTNAPREQHINIGENSFLYYISDEVGSGTGSTADQALEVKINFGGGVFQTWYVLNYQASAAYDILAIGVGPADLNRYVDLGFVRDNFGVVATQSIITCDVVDYEVKITNFGLVG